MNCTANLTTAINTLHIFLDNFPDNIIKGSLGQTEYDSVLDFILAMLRPFGLGPWEVFSLLLSKISKISEPIINEVLQHRDTMENLAETWDIAAQNGVLGEIESAVKYAIAATLSAIPTCSAVINVGDKYLDPHLVVPMDNSDNNDGVSFNATITGGILVPLRLIDPMNYLRFCPLSRRGKGYYDFSYDDMENDIVSVSDLYRSSDFNAFLWYCKNRSLKAPQREINKTMWDNRYEIKFRGKKDKNEEGSPDYFDFLTPEFYENWISSKTEPVYNELNVNSKLHSDQDLEKKLKPVLQVTYYNNPEPSFLFQIPSQEFYQTRKAFKGHFKLNKTLFEFNSQYLQSIHLFSAKSIITSLYDTLCSGMYLDDLEFNIEKILPREKIREVIKKVLKSDATEINDCYFSFSNSEFNSMLEALEKQKFSAIDKNRADGKYDEVAKKDVMEALDEILNPTSEIPPTLHEEQTLIENTLIEYTSKESKEQIGGLKASISDNWLMNMLETLIMSLMLPIFTPKVLSLVMINYRILGYPEEISLEVFLTSCLSVLISCIKVVINSIVKLLLEEIVSRLSESIVAYAMVRSLEMAMVYMRLLQTAYDLCVPKFKFPSFDYDKAIDNVDHADIIPEKTAPDSKTNC